MRHLIATVQYVIANQLDEYEASGWQLTRARGGHNGLVYRAQSLDTAQVALAVKVSQADERDRALRSFSALRALWWNGIERVAPYPLSYLPQPDGFSGGTYC